MNPKSNRRIGVWLSIAALLLAVWSSAAFASTAPPDSAAGDQYGDVAGVVDVDPTPPTRESVEPAGTLPFTGVTLALAAVIGLGLLAAGVGIRRLSRSSPPADA